MRRGVLIYRDAKHEARRVRQYRRRHDFPMENRRCDARTRAGGHCRRWAMPGKTRCHLHGGNSCGPRSGPCSRVETILFRNVVLPDEQKTDHAGAKRKVTARMVEGRRRWLAELKAQGLRAPCGRKRKNTPPPTAAERLDAKREKARTKAARSPDALAPREQEKRQEEQQAAADALMLARLEQDRIARQAPPLYDRNRELAQLAIDKAALAGFYGERAQAAVESKLRSYPSGEPRREANGPVFASPQGRLAWERR